MIETQTSSFIDPARIVQGLGIAPSSVVADFGCGTGFFSLAFASEVGEDGKVYALDVLPQSIELVLKGAKNAGIHNIEARRVDIEVENGTKLADKCVDVVFIKDVLYQSQSREILLAEAFRVLKSDGKLIVAEWREEAEVIGPERKYRLNGKEIEKLIDGANFSIITQKELGGHHLLVIALKK